MNVQRNILPLKGDYFLNINKMFLEHTVMQNSILCILLKIIKIALLISIKCLINIVSELQKYRNSD